MSNDFMRKYNFSIDLAAEYNEVPQMFFVEGDIDSACFRVTVTNCGKTIDLQGRTFTAAFYGPSRQRFVTKEIVAISPEFEIVLPEYALSEKGCWHASVQIYQGKQKLSSCPWEYYVVESIDDGAEPCGHLNHVEIEEALEVFADALSLKVK